MNAFYAAAAVFVALTLLGGLARVVRGPTPSDRLMAAQLFGTAGVAVLLLLGEASGSPGLGDVALVFALLAAVNAAAFAARAPAAR